MTILTQPALPTAEYLDSMATDYGLNFEVDHLFSLYGMDLGPSKIRSPCTPLLYEDEEEIDNCDPLPSILVEYRDDDGVLTGREYIYFD